ncbi:MAG TPA: homoserine dehydrogenase [Fimbriimonas sp.]|nr:homoserine dehydrogenase [Fimbriimonas sp.]
MTSKTLRVGMLGYGTVGSGAYRMIRDNQQAIQRKTGLSVEVVKIGIRDLSKERELPKEIFTADLCSIVDDPGIDVVLELIGGIDPAAELVERALQNGKNVVLANKELMAKHGSRLVGLAKSKNLDLHYEAAVGGGIPLVQPLKHQLAGNDVLSMRGILNGTTNYILTAMEQEGADFADVLADAQAKGYAEADPTNDVDGFDTVYKIAILASIVYGRQVPVEEVYREGIRKVSRVDMEYAGRLGYRIKLLGVVDALLDESVRVRVHPSLVPLAHPLASVSGVYNALWLHGDFVGDVMFSGRGAGSDPTASAVIGDLIDVARNVAVGGQGSAIPYGTGMKTEGIESLTTPYYLRLIVQDRPMVLGQISMEFGRHNVSLAAMEMKVLEEGRGEIVFLTHPCVEKSFHDALAQLRRQQIVEEIANAFRVVD